MCLSRKGGVTGQLQVNRAGSRQRSLTPTTLPPVQFKTTPSAEPPRAVSTQSVQWSSRTTANVQQPNVSSLQQRTFQINLSEPETADDDTWNRPSRSEFLDARGVKEHLRSPSNGPSLFSGALPPQPRPSSAAQNKSPAIWKPTSWQPESTEPTRTSFSQETSLTRFNASTQNNSRENAWKPPSWQTESSRTTFSEENYAATPRFNSNDWKENVPPPAVNRSTPALQNNEVEVAKHKPNIPNIWQPSPVPQTRKASLPVPSSVSPGLVDFGLEFDLSDGGGGRGGSGWKPTKRKDDAFSADGFGKQFLDMPPHLNKILSANVDDDEEFGSILHDKEKSEQSIRISI